MAAKPDVLERQTELEPVSLVPEEPAEHPLAKLQAVHDEATETSALANLLGRTLYAALLLPVLVLGAIALSDPPLTRGMSFSALVLMGAGALFFAYAKTSRAPFDRAALRAFSADLEAILLYTGFAWGAGAFLILPANTARLTPSMRWSRRVMAKSSS